MLFYADREESLAKSLNVVENLKNRLLTLLARLFDLISQGKQDLVKKTLGEVILNSYLLGRRLGISYQAMDKELVKQAQDYVEKKDEVEEYFGDITDLLQYYRVQKK